MIRVIYSFHKKSIPLFLILLLISSCRFTHSIEGEYKGTFSGYLMPVNSGEATVNLVKVDDNHYNIIFSSAGNPDYVFNNLEVTRYGYFDGDIHQFGLGEYFGPIYMYGNVSDRDNSVYISYEDSTNVSFTVDAYKQ